MLVFGGLYKGSNGKYLALNRVDQYDPVLNKWTTKNNMPEAITHSAVVNLGDVAYFVGGYVGNHPGPGTTHVWIYTFATDSWTAGPDLPAPRGAGTATLIGNEIHFAGGRDYNRDTDEVDHWALDLNNLGAGWQTRASLPDPRNQLSSGFTNGKWYVLGGEHLEEADTMNSAELDIYDPLTDSWSRGADMPVPTSHVHQSTIVYNGKILTFGGELSHNIPTAQVLMYDPTTNIWSLLGYLPGQRRAGTASLIGNKVYFSGGYGSGVQNTTTWSATLNV
jgi:N-acetylneuraminic acid mutarotase